MNTEKTANPSILSRTTGSLMFTLAPFLVLAGIELLLYLFVKQIKPDAADAVKGILLLLYLTSVLPLIFSIAQGQKKSSLIAPVAYAFLLQTGIAFQAMILQPDEFEKVKLVLTLTLVSTLLVYVVLSFWGSKAEFFNNKKIMRILHLIFSLGMFAVCVGMRFTSGYKDAYNWIYVGGTSVQISEVLKLVYILTIVLALKASDNDKGRLIRLSVSAASLSMGTLLCNEAGTSLIAVFTFLVCAFVSIKDPKVLIRLFAAFGALTLVSVVGALVVHSLFSESSGILRTMYLLSDKLISRILNLSDNYQITVAKNSMRLGGLFGKRTRFISILPLYDSDMVFASLSTRLGALWAGLIILAFGYIYFKSIGALNFETEKTTNKSILLLPSATLTFSQAMIAIMSNLGIIPIAGLTLPMLSNGGTSLIINSSILVMNIALLNNSAAFAPVLREEDN